MGEGGRIHIENGEIVTGSARSEDVEPRERIYPVKVNEQSCLSVPRVMVRKLGLEPAAELEMVVNDGRIELRPNIHSLARVYIEPTARCNLACSICIRNAWQEPLGDMDRALFDRLATQLREFPHLDSLMFGGFGEPTAHPDILHMIQAVKELGVSVEMTTNGTRLDETMIAGLMGAGLDRLWVSLDGVSEESFNGIRQGASFDSVMTTLRRLREMNRHSPRKVDVGIAFVVMKKNIDDLRRIDRLIEAAGARFVSISNLLPYTEAMEQEMESSNVHERWI